jgi:hypothetical protein
MQTNLGNQQQQQQLAQDVLLSQHWASAGGGSHSHAHPHSHQRPGPY